MATGLNAASSSVLGQPLAASHLWASFIRGGDPVLVADPGRDASPAYNEFFRTYLERDLPALRHVSDPSLFQTFLREVAIRTGKPFRLSDVSRALGAAVNTVKSWVGVLEETRQVVVLQPFADGGRSRLVKTPKVYFTDAGSLCYLTGLTDADQSSTGLLSGAIVETAVLSEMRRTLTHRGEDPQITFWCTAKGVEVDFVVETSDGFVPVDVTNSATPRPGMAAGVKAFRAAAGDRALPGYVVHTGDIRSELRPDVVALPFGEL